MKKKEKSYSLASEYPHIAAQWHPTKNGDVKPEQIKPNSKTKYIWLLSYDDPETGKHFDFEWPASPNDRVNAKGTGCPFLAGKAVWPGYNDLASKYPELAKQWHPSKNGDLIPEKVTCGKNKKVWWYLLYIAPETEKVFEFEWQAWIADRVKGAECPFLTGNAVWPGYNDFQGKEPELAKQWHPTKNGDLKPSEVAHNRHKKVWWIYPYDDPITGLHFDFEWEASPNSRVTNRGCPFLSGKAVWTGFNDLETRYPDVAKQWHPTRNGNKKPSEVSFSSNDKYWWYLSYDDPELGHFDFEWEATVNNRTSLNEGCPYLGNDKVWVGFNDLKTRFPEIAAEWHPEKNGKLTPRDVVYGTPKSVWWKLCYTDYETKKSYEFEWKAPVNIRTGVATNDGHHTGCPYLAPNPKVWPGFNDLESQFPVISAQFHPKKNRKIIASQIYKESTDKYWWRCPECGHEWYASVRSRTVDEVGCPKCRKQRKRY